MDYTNHPSRSEDVQGWNLLVDQLVADGVADLDRPHTLVSLCEGEITVSGPFPDALSALCALRLEEALDADPLLGLGARKHWVAPLLDGICAHTPLPH